MPKDEVEAVVRDGGNFTKVGLEVFAENFNNSKIQFVEIGCNLRNNGNCLQLEMSKTHLRESGEYDIIQNHGF